MYCGDIFEPIGSLVRYKAMSLYSHFGLHLPENSGILGFLGADLVARWF
jgi:hypothetical protein